MQKVTTIENISISADWKNDKAFLFFLNRSPNSESIGLLCLESGNSSPKQWMNLRLPRDEEQRVELPEDFIRWEKFGFCVKGKNSLAPTIKLTKLLNDVKLQHEAEKLTSIQQPANNTPESPEKPANSLGQNLQPANPFPRKKTSIPGPSKSRQRLTPKPTRQKNNDQQNQQITKLQTQNAKLEQIVAELQKTINSLEKQNAELVEENNELKTMLDTRTDLISRNPEQVFHEAASHVLQILFAQHENEGGEAFQYPKQICKGIETEIRRFEEQFDGQMIYTLSVVKEHLIKVKGLIHFELSELSLPENQPEELAKLVLTDELSDDVQFPYLGELGKAYWDTLKAFTTKLPQVIVEIQALLQRIVIQLLDGFSPYRAKTAKEKQMSRCFYEDYLPNILRMMSLELVPIEIGQTEADSRIHDIQGSQRGTYKRGVVADIIQHGVRRISDKQIIRKPIVMRGEPE